MCRDGIFVPCLWSLAWMGFWKNILCLMPWAICHRRSQIKLWCFDTKRLWLKRWGWCNRPVTVWDSRLMHPSNKNRGTMEYWNSTHIYWAFGFSGNDWYTNWIPESHTSKGEFFHRKCSYWWVTDSSLGKSNEELNWGNRSINIKKRDYSGII